VLQPYLHVAITKLVFPQTVYAFGEIRFWPISALEVAAFGAAGTTAISDS
jgi:hypothetical protein